MAAPCKYFINGKTLSKEQFLDYVKTLSQDEIANVTPLMKKKVGEFSSSHFDEKNILVHIRHNTRTDSEGNKVLFLEEVQSDWGQKGKKEGFDEKYKESEVKVLDENAPEANQPNLFWYFKVPGNVLQIPKSRYKTIEEAKNYVVNDKKKVDSGVPQAPFVTDTNSWTKLGLKVALKEAVSQGVDKIAWSTGTQQFDRWGSEEIHWRKNTTRTPQEEARMKELGEKIVNYKDTNEERVEHEKLARKEGGFSLLISEQTSGATAFNGQESGYKDDATIQSKEDLRKAIKKNLSRERNNAEIDKLTDRIWNRMQTEDIGTSLPRKEGMEEFYGNPADMERAKNFNIKKEGELFAVKDEKGKTIRTFKQENEANKFKENYGLGIVGNVAKSLFKQEPKTVEIVTDKNTLLNESYSEEQPDGQYKIWNGQDRKWEYDLTETDANKRANKLNEKYVKKTTSTQHSIDITPELKAETQQGLPMFQKIEDLPRFNQRQITDEFIDEDWDTWTSAITLISAKDSYVNALAIIDEIIAKRKYQNDDDELNDLLDDIIDFDNSDFRNHHTAVLYNNALQNNYIRFALTARAQSLYEKSTNDETKKLAKYIIGMSRLEMGDIARDAALSLTSFNANIVPTDKGIMSLFLPANANTDKVNKKNSYKESGEQRTDIEEAKFVRDETKKRILEHLEESGNIDDVINRLLDKIESGQISQPIGFTSPKNTIDVDKKTWAKNKSDKYVSKGLDLIKNGLSHFKKLGVVPDPQGDAEAIFDIFKGSVYIALGKLLKAKQIFSEIASELGISPEKEWDKYAESEVGKAHIAEVKRTAAIDKLKKISPKTGVKETRDHFDEFFDRLRASRNKNSKRIIKNIQQKISELGENTKLNEEEVKLIEDAIIILESENYDTEAAGYEARVGKIDELQEMLDALSSKESTNPLSQETRRRRKVREIVKDSLGGKRALLKEIIADFIKYGSARSTLSELLADVLPIDQAKELEKEVFEELDKMLEESSEAISKEEKKNREATIKDLSNKLSSLQENNREIEMIRGELSKLENSEDSSSKSRQMAELSDRLERLTGEKIDKNKTKQELLSDAKKELNELSSRDNLTDEEKLHKKHLLSHIKLLESNAELDAVIADLNRSIKETSKSQKKEQGTKKTVSNLIDKLNKIKEGTYKQKTKKEVKVTEEIKALRKQIRELSGARSKLKSFTDRWSPEALLKAIKMGAHDLTDFFAILEDSTDFNFTPKQKKLLYHIHTLVRSSITGQNGHVQNLAATNKAIAMLRNLKSQTNKDVLKRFLYSMASEWAYDSMLSHPSSTINSLLGSVSGYSRIIVEAITRLLKPSDRKAAFKIIKSVWGDFLDSASKAIGLFFSQRSEMALNDLENGFMASGVIDRIWRDKFKDIAKSDSGIVKKVAKIIIKLAVAPVKLMMNIFSATDVFSRNMFRSWNEKWDVYDKVVSKRTESGLDILNAINEELGLKQEVYDQANKEADDLGYTLIRKREYVAKRVLELREQFINDYILVAHADHAARKVMLINNPETSVGASFYSRMNKLNKNENDASYVSLVLMAIKNQIIPFSRNLVNFSHKHLVNTTIPISMVAAGMGKKAEIVTRQSLVANLLTQQYDNYRKTIESKQEYDEMYYRYKSMDENSPEAKSLKRRLDEFIIGGVPVFRNGKIEKEIYTKRDLLLDALESALGYSTALMIFMSYDDDETEQGIVAKKPNWLRVTGSAHGLTYAEKDAANYTPFSIQVKSDDGWNTVLKWPYVFAHPVFFYLGSMTDKNYDKNTNYGLQESSVAEILYHLASSPLSQGSQQGLQTIADATLFVSKEDSSEETLEKLWKSLVTNTARQSVTPGAYVFMSELNRWFTNQTVMTSDDPFKNQLSKMPFLDGLADKTKLSPFGYPYTQPIPIKLAEYFFEDNGQENELTNINKYLVENSVNGVLKYYNSGSNISDDLQGDILIKGFPEEKQFELRDAVASAYGRIVAESNIYNDTKDYKKDYVTSKKALQQTFQKYYEEAIKEGKDLVLREYVMGIATEELEKETYPEKNGKQLLKFVKSKEDITTAMKEWGIRIDDGKIKYIDKMMSPVEIY